MSRSRIRCLVVVLAAAAYGCGGGIDRADAGGEDARSEDAPGEDTGSGDADSEGFVSVSIQRATNCALHSSGLAVCWGYSFATPFVFDGPIAQVSAGWNQACVLTGSEIRCEPAPFAAMWSRHPDLPSAAYTQVASGLAAICGLTEAGAVDCWRWGDEETEPVLPAPTSERILRLRLNVNWACVLTETSAGHCWNVVPQGESIVPFPRGEYIDVTTDTRGAHCGIDFDGEIQCAVGKCRPDPDRPGELLPCDDDRGWPERVGLGPGGPFVKLSMSMEFFMCALRPSGELACWGDDYESIRAMEPNVRFVDFDVGPTHVCGVTVDGDIRCWGRVRFGEEDWGQLAPPAWP